MPVCSDDSQLHKGALSSMTRENRDKLDKLEHLPDASKHSEEQPRFRLGRDLAKIKMTTAPAATQPGWPRTAKLNVS